MSNRLRPLLILSACCVLSASACDKGEEKKPDTKTAKTEGKKAETKTEKTEAKEAKAPEQAAVLTLGAAKLMDESKPEEVLELLPDGGIKLNGTPLGRLSADGKFTGPDGKVFLEVGADGKVSAEGEPIGLELVDGGGRVTVDEKTSMVTFADDGSIKVDPEEGKGPEMTHEGCTGPMAKTCALVIFGLLMPAEETSEVPAEVKGEAVPAPEGKAKADG